MKQSLKILLALALLVPVAGQAQAQKKNPRIDIEEALRGYFKPVSTPSSTPDADGFIRRWMMLEPISKPNPSNRVFTDSYTREQLSKEYFSGQLTVLPKAAQPRQEQPRFVKATLTWHALDSDHFFVKLFRFATGLDKDRYGVIFWTVTVINCEEDIENVRLSVGSNKAARWWVNGEEVLLLAGDRHMGVDSAVSDRITLKKGKNILRGVTMNGPGMSEFCARFIDDLGRPVTNYTVTCN